MTFLLFCGSVEGWHGGVLVKLPGVTVVAVAWSFVLRIGCQVPSLTNTRLSEGGRFQKETRQRDSSSCLFVFCWEQNGQRMIILILKVFWFSFCLHLCGNLYDLKPMLSCEPSVRSVEMDQRSGRALPLCRSSESTLQESSSPGFSGGPPSSLWRQHAKALSTCCGLLVACIAVRLRVRKVLHQFMFYSTHYSFLSKPAAYITHNATSESRLEICGGGVFC